MYELRMVGTYIDFLLKIDALNVINSIACSIVDPHWSIASILVDIYIYIYIYRERERERERERGRERVLVNIRPNPNYVEVLCLLNFYNGRISW
jgi:hypothetical protein